MAKPRARKLKVFQAQFGFYDTVVAAPSRAAALRAWGVHQDIFAAGTASETTHDEAVAVAIAHPDFVLKRPVGSTAPYELDPTALPDVPDARLKKAGASKSKAKPAARKVPEPDRSGLDEAERKLRALDEERKAQEASLRQESEALDAKRAAAQGAYVEARKAASAAVVAARQAYRKAGGAD